MSPTQRKEPPRRVFLSYSSEDDAAADTIRQSLAAYGVEVWSSEDLKPGDNIAASIQREIDEADDVLILMSPSSEESPWVEYEAAAALATRELGARRKRIIPVLLDANVRPPPVLARFNYLDLSNPDKWQEGLTRLAKTVELDEPELTNEEEKRLEREHLAIEKLALEQARIAHETRVALHEGLLRFALKIAVAVSATAFLFLVLLGVLGQVSEVVIAFLGTVVGALFTPLFVAERD